DPGAGRGTRQLRGFIDCRVQVRIVLVRTESAAGFVAHCRAPVADECLRAPLARRYLEGAIRWLPTRRFFAMAMSPTLSPFPRSASLVAKDGMWRSRWIFVPAQSPTARWRRKSGTNRVKRGARRVHEIPPGEPQETRRRPTGKHRWPSAFPGQRRSKCD